MIMKWYKIVGFENYEINDAVPPVVRNRITRKRLKVSAAGQVRLFGRGTNIHTGILRIQYAAMHGLDLDMLPQSLVFTRYSGRSTIVSRQEHFKMIRARPVYEKDVQAVMLKTAIQFLELQLNALENGSYSQLVEFLYRQGRRAVHDFHEKYACSKKLGELTEYARTGVLEIFDGLMNGQVYMKHPVAAIQVEINRCLRAKRKETLRAMNER